METGIPLIIKRKWLDVPYADKSDAQRLDIYLPNTGNGPFPVIATFHGGAWMFGDKGDDMNLPFLEGLKRGYAVACVNYRLSGEAHFPSQIHDCKTAIRYLRTNAAAYHLDGGHVGAWGASAGGHLAALLGTTPRVRGLDDPSMRKTNTRLSCKVQAVAIWFGPLEDFLKMDEQLAASGMGTPDHSNKDSPESQLLGRKITDIPALVGAWLLAGEQAAPVGSARRYDRARRNGVAFYLPFYRGFTSQAGGIAPNLYNGTRFPQFYVMFGPYLTIGLLFGLTLIQQAVRGRQAPWLSFTGKAVAGGAGIVVALALVAGVLGFVVTLVSEKARTTVQNTVAAMAQNGLSVSDHLMARLLSPWTPLLLGIALASIVLLWLARRKQSAIEKEA